MRPGRAPVETAGRPRSARSATGPPAPLRGEIVRGRLLPVRQNLTAPLGIDAWVSCQPGDEDPAQFAAACCRSVSPAWAGTPRRAADVLAAMRELSPIDVCLIVDDAHLLAGSASELLLAEVVRQLPRHGHVVLSGREPVDVPLARLRVTGGCTGRAYHDAAASVLGRARPAGP